MTRSKFKSHYTDEDRKSLIAIAKHFDQIYTICDKCMNKLEELQETCKNLKSENEDYINIDYVLAIIEK